MIGHPSVLAGRSSVPQSGPGLTPGVGECRIAGLINSGSHDILPQSSCPGCGNYAPQMEEMVHHPSTHGHTALAAALPFLAASVDLWYGWVWRPRLAQEYPYILHWAPVPFVVYIHLPL